MKYKILGPLIIVSLLCFGFYQKQELPEGFVYVKSVIPDLDVKLKYYTTNNFVGDTIDGYNSNKLILTKAAAEKLKLVQDELQEQNLCLLVHDGFQALGVFFVNKEVTLCLIILSSLKFLPRSNHVKFWSSMPKSFRDSF